MDRYCQIQPKILFTDVEAPYDGRTIDLIPKITKVVRVLLNTGLQNVVSLPSSISGAEKIIPNLPKRWATLLDSTYAYGSQHY